MENEEQVEEIEQVKEKTYKLTFSESELKARIEELQLDEDVILFLRMSRPQEQEGERKFNELQMLLSVVQKE